MAIRPLKSFLPTADDVVNSDIPTLGRILLVHLKSYEGQSPAVYQPVGGINREYFLAVTEHRNVGIGPLPGNGPEYGPRQPEVSQALGEAWNWLEKEGHLMHTRGQPVADWFSITRSGEEQIKRFTLYEQLERLGLDRVKSELSKERPRLGTVDGGASEKDLIWEWVREKENKPPLKRAPVGDRLLIDDGRLAELRALQSAQFDFKKLIRFCEELNTASREGCYITIGILTRGLLDHVPPVFGVKSFSEVASNYAGATKSFKDSMLHLDTAARKIADGLLHTQIRKRETLPNHQQVNFGPELDVLLGEIVRINSVAKTAARGY
ncbi:MAG TPA: hypothetical protein VIY49_27340 [Bryobacteraceae bacterium]